MAEHDADNATWLPELVDRIVAGYQADDRMHHLDATFLPTRNCAIEIIELFRRLIFPGFFDDQKLMAATARFHVGDLINTLHGLLYDQIRQALRYDKNRLGACDAADDGDNDCDVRAARITRELLDRICEIRHVLAKDVQAAFDGDPASTATDENIFCYPGIDAIFTYRIAHELYRMNVPLLPRIMSEYAHGNTGIDIHPGAQIDEFFFIDHGTGVVIGETTQIGKRVKIYQGVTLGALSTKGGQAWRGRKRHPTIEDDVTIYGGAIILGGNTVIGQGCTIGGSVFLTTSVPPDHTVSLKRGQLDIKERKQRAKTTTQQEQLDFSV
jgi:serine O-acetyltransferase